MLMNLVSRSVVVAMPAHNEGEGIGEFVTEIADAFHDLDISFVVVDDVSSDDTVSILKTLDEKIKPMG